MSLVFKLVYGVVLAGVVAASAAFGQAAGQSAGSYRDYPQTVGAVQTFAFHLLPSWMTVAFEVRGPSEGQTEIGSASGNGYGYELTRARGPLDLRPSKWLNMYAQFQDAHALALPVADTAANMRNSFDVRQMYTEFDLPKRTFGDILEPARIAQHPRPRRHLGLRTAHRLLALHPRQRLEEHIRFHGSRRGCRIRPCDGQPAPQCVADQHLRSAVSECA
jgi:hypothetical protein